MAEAEPTANTSQMTSDAEDEATHSVDGKNANDANQEAERATIVEYDYKQKLEKRLLNAIYCVVCKKSPATPYYQCSDQHLICIRCFQVQLKDQAEYAICPICHVSIDFLHVTRNDVAQIIAQEMPEECVYCKKIYCVRELSEHMAQFCEMRPAPCKFHKLGCKWRGTYNELSKHMQECSIKDKTGRDLFEYLNERQLHFENKRKELESILEVCKRTNIFFNTVAVSAIDDCTTFFQVSEFRAFDKTWSLWIRSEHITEDAYDNRTKLYYKLLLHDSITNVFKLNFALLNGTYANIKFKVHMNTCEYKSDVKESAESVFVKDTRERITKLLSTDGLYMRICMSVPDA